MNFAFPVGGGTLGAFTQLQAIASESHWGLVWDTIIVSLTGAIIGILVNEVWKSIKKRRINKQSK